MAWFPQTSMPTTASNGPTAKPDETALISSLQSMNKDELQRLIDNEDAIRDMVVDSSQIKSMTSHKATVQQQNKTVAECNLAMEPRITEIKAKLAHLHEMMQEARNKFNTSRATVDSMADKHSMGSVLAILQAALAADEERSEDVANAFLAGSQEADKFFDEYLPLRKQCNERRIKAEKMTELVNSSRVSGGGISMGSAAPNMATPPTHNFYNTPYPSGPSGFPMPQPPSFGHYGAR